MKNLPTPEGHVSFDISPYDPWEDVIRQLQEVLKLVHDGWGLHDQFTMGVSLIIILVPPSKDQ